MSLPNWMSRARRLVPLVVSVTLLVVPAVVGHSGGPTLTKELIYSADDLRVSRFPEGARYLLPGAVPWGRAGDPEIPAVPVSLELPEGQEVAGFEFRVDSEEGFSPGLAPWVASEDPVAVGEADPAVYASDRFLPSQRVLFTGVGYSRGRRLAMFAVHPLRVRPSNGDLMLATRSELVVRLKPAAVPALGSAAPPAREARHDDAALGFAPTEAPSTQGSAVDMVIVCPDEVAGEYQRLADWKTKKGVPAVVRTVSWIRTHYPEGVDLAERIRLFVRDANTLWGAEWLLLGGDTDKIPIKYPFIRFYASPGVFLATDLYFAALDGNWNDDGDHLFGEAPQYFGTPTPGDSVDLYPDVFVGRLPGSDVATARTMVDKVLSYERTPLPRDFFRILVLAEVLFPSEWQFGRPISVDGAKMADSTLKFAPSVPPARLYENYYAYPGSFRESRGSALDSLNKGYNLTLHIGHGFRNTMAVGGELESHRLNNEDADALQNTPRYGILYALNCASAAVDYNCIAERFLANPNGGMCGVIGAADLDFPSTSFPYQTEFFKLLFQRGVYHLGEAFARANEPFVPLAQFRDNADRWMQFTQILLGDPEMEVWTSVPQPLAATHPSTLTLGQTSLQVTVTSSGAPVPNARVCLYKAGDAYALGTTNASGVALVTVTPDSIGTMSVTVTKHDYYPYQGTVTVGAAAPGTPYLIVDALSLADPLGNGDGVANPGESADLTLRALNRGSSATGAVTATLTSAHSGVAVTQGSTTLGPVAAGATATAASAFRIGLAASLEDLEEVMLTVSMTSGTTWTRNVYLKVEASRLRIYQMAVHDTVGGADGDGVLEAGETADVAVSFVNLGHGANQGIDARLRPVGGRVAVYDSVGAIAALAPGAFATATPAFRLQAAADSVPAARLVVSDGNGTLLSADLDFVAPVAPDSLWTSSAPTAISLNWVPSAAADLAGYYVYRSLASGGPFERIHDEIVPMSYYRSEQLTELTRYYFRVVTVDRSGNFSAPSIVTSASTSAPLMLGWPVLVDGSVKPTGPAISDLNSAITSDGTIEIVSAGGRLHAFEPDGREYVDGDRQAVTLGIFSGRGKNIWCTPAIADLEGDHSKEIVVQSWGEFTTSGDESLFVYDGTFAKVKPNFPQKIMNGNWGSPALADIEGDSKLEIVAVAGNRVYAWRSNGVEVINGDNDPTTNGVFLVLSSATALYGSPALADIDGDNKSDIIVAERRSGSSTNNQLYVYKGNGTPVAGFPKTIVYHSTASPAVADLDGSVDSFRPEIIVATADSVLVFNHDGTPFVGGPPHSGQYNYNNFLDLMSSPAVGDVNLDNQRDIVIGSRGGVIFAWTGRTGQTLPGFPLQVSQKELGSPVIANLDQDPELEILISDYDGYVHGLNHDGTLLEGWPYKTGNAVYGSPLIWDVDGNGTTNVVISSSDQYIYLLDLPSVPFEVGNPDAHPWPKFRHDARNTGSFAVTDPDPVALASLTAQHRGGGVVDLSWEATSEYLTFHVYRQADGGAELKVGTVPGRAGEGYLSYGFADAGVPEGRYLYWVGAVPRSGGAEERIGPLRVEVSTTGVPVVAELLQNAPNPFNPVTTIRYRVPASLGRTRMTLRVYSVSGRVVATLIDGLQEAGEHAVAWDGRDDEGRALASGLYVYRLEGRGVSISRKMSLLQ